MFRRKRSVWYWRDWYVRQLGSVAKNTIKARHGAFQNLEEWLNGRDLLKVKPGDLSEFERYLGQGRKASTVHVNFVILKHFFTLLVRYRHLKRSPFKSYKMPKKPKTQHRQYDFKEVVPRLLAACKNEEERLVIVLAVMTGARREELAGMKWEDVDFTNGCIRVVGKGDKYREIVISGRLEDELRRNRNGTPFILKTPDTGDGGVAPVTVYFVIRKVARRAGIPKLTPHDLRRIYAGEFLRLGKDPACLQEQLGHSDIRTTLECYCVPTKKKKQAIVDGFELRG